VYSRLWENGGEVDINVKVGNDCDGGGGIVVESHQALMFGFSS
jgi:hypothetical protein